MAEDACIREFFNQLAMHHLDERCASRRLDLLACGNIAQGASGASIVQQLESLLGVSQCQVLTHVISPTIYCKIIKDGLVKDDADATRLFVL